MAAPSLLLGPPELHRLQPPSTTTQPFIDLMVGDFNKMALQPPSTTTTAAADTDPFIDLMVEDLVEDFNKMGLQPPKILTENNSAAFSSTGNPCLDFFFHIVPDTLPESLRQRLHLAWSHDPLITLKLICNLRGVRGNGNSDKEGFYTAAFWLFKNHPRTLACNVGCFADFGYFKDLPEILYRLLEGPDARRIQKAEWLKRKHKNGRRRRFIMCRRASKRSKNPKSSLPREVRILNRLAKAKQEREKASALRHDKRIAMAKKAVERYTRDPDFRFLYDRVSEYFAECLRADMEALGSGDLKRISLAAKWCPSIYSSFDRSTLICESIARLVFPRESYPEYEGIEEAHYAYRVRDRLRKQVLVPLRKALELPEVYIGANQWGSIPYNRVASVAMKLYKNKFLKHDKERFEQYLAIVKSGKAKIAAGALFPHEIIQSLNDDEDGGEVAELQWKRMVDDLLKKGKLENCLAVCDVSGSMSGIPMAVSIALGILVSELSKEPWKGKVISFSRDPQLHLIEGDNLCAKTEFVRHMDWGCNTNFQKVFDLILQVAGKGQLKEDDMIKRVFVFSDMEFDQPSANPWETDYEAITRKYRECGYGNVVPQIVFWNLRDSRSTPVMGKQQGVALVSGFSKNLLNLFLDGNEDIDPEVVMHQAISGEEYQKLLVVD